MSICRKVKEDKKKGPGKKNHVGYVLGSVALFAVGCVAIPMIIPKITGIMYKAAVSVRKDDEDDWGPIIERKVNTQSDKTKKKEDE